MMGSAPGNTISGNGLIGAQGHGIAIAGPNAMGNVVRGNLVGTDATGTRALGNGLNGVYLQGAPGNTIGGETLVGIASPRNVIAANGQAGVKIEGAGASGNKVLGNSIGVNAAGTVALSNGSDGVVVQGAPGNIIGGAAAPAGALPGNVISGNSGNGVGIYGTAASGNKVLGNLIGPDAVGAASLGNTRAGVAVDSASGNTIGGPRSGAGPQPGNVISGNGEDGIQLTRPGATTNTVQGNFIGAAADGTSALGNDGHGVFFTLGASENDIGGAGAGEGNVIAHNAGAGVFADSGRTNTFAVNSIFANDSLGLDLAPAGATANDSGDADDGPNRLQNFPLLLTLSANRKTLTGSINSQPSQSYRLEFFASPTCDPSGYGEGGTFLGATTATTNASGNAAFSATFVNAVPAGDQMTATATDPNGNTSEFSRCFDGATPIVDAIEPASASAGINVEVTILGYFFQPGLQAAVGSSIVQGLQHLPDETAPPFRARVRGTLVAGLAPGARCNRDQSQRPGRRTRPGIHRAVGCQPRAGRGHRHLRPLHLARGDFSQLSLRGLMCTTRKHHSRGADLRRPAEQRHPGGQPGQPAGRHDPCVQFFRRRTLPRRGEHPQHGPGRRRDQAGRLVRWRHHDRDCAERPAGLH
ncbi:MAG: right-handed parallel beta-helix repeat-containing protein [Anaerolineae bacterium]|nr:right-handed parallel beta-helix repeat-containing protein [Anaerolineae bacterium]